MREAEKWFERMVQRRTGWVVDEVFSFDPMNDNALFVRPAEKRYQPADFESSMVDGPVTDERGHLRFDLPGFSAWMLSRVEETEAFCGWRVVDRFMPACSLMEQHELTSRPVVDVLIDRFCREIVALRDRRGMRTPEISRPWPGGKKVAVAISHDVDLLDGRTALWARKLFWRMKMTKAKLHGDLPAAKALADRIARWSRGKDDPVWSLPNWLDEETEKQIRATYYFFGLRTNLSLEGRRYHAKHPRLLRAFTMLAERGCEIGLHAASHFADRETSLRGQLQRLNAASPVPIRSVRNHFLNVRFPDTWTMMSNLGLANASNVAWFGGVNGFRAGTSFPYVPGELPCCSESNGLVEVPFQVMDASKITDVPRFVDAALSMYREAKNVGGSFVINFHTDYFDEIEAPGVHEAYRKIVAELVSDSDAWIAPISEIADQYRMN